MWKKTGPRGGAAQVIEHDSASLPAVRASGGEDVALFGDE
jgi:hypothetical protein